MPDAPRFPQQRWQIAPAQPDKALYLAQLTQLSPLLTQVLLNRGLETPEAVQVFLEPEVQALPSPLEDFLDLPIALELLLNAIATRQPIAICGDYDADGMTSTALLLRALRALGAIVDYAIPSRMQEGYGINQRIIEEFYEEGVRLVLTVDNGIAAYDPIVRARELGLTVIITDHHDLPPLLPPANAILNPKLIRADSPYRGVAGVGVAYILAVCLAQSLKKMQDLTAPLIELFTLGTIADLAPLTGVNRRWVRRGLKLLPKSKLPGIQSLIQVAGLGSEKALKPEAIGFRLGPRINAIGRISDPQIVIELLTTEDEGRALELAMKCEQVNQLRQRLCELIEQQAILWCEETQFNPQQARVLVVVQPEWHHGVIGIVASRLVERYGVPVFIGTYEEDDPNRLRGSARGIPEFNVFEALQFCGDLLDKFGGHRAAGGFSMQADRLDAFRSQLQAFAQQQLQPEYLKPLVTIDTEAAFSDLHLALYEQIDALHPCGIENPDPVLWTPDVRVVEQQTIGRDRAHLKLTLAQSSNPDVGLRALAWRWGECYPLPDRMDVAYKLRINDWNGVRSLELELVGVRLPTAVSDGMRNIAAVATPVRDLAPSRLEKDDAAIETIAALTELVTDSTVHRTDSSIDAVNDSDDQMNGMDTADISLPLQQSDAEFKDDRSKSHGSDPLENQTSSQAESDIQNFLSQLSDDCSEPALLQRSVEFYFNARRYVCTSKYLETESAETLRQLSIVNTEGQILEIWPEQKRGLLRKTTAEAAEIDISQPFYFNLLRAALSALELAEKNQLLREKEQQIEQMQQQITALTQQVEQLQQQVVQLSAQPSAQVLSEPQTQPSPVQAQIQPSQIQQTQIQQAQLLPVAPSPDDIKRSLRAALSDCTWDHLDPRTQKDLMAAYKQQYECQMAEFTASAADYSGAGLLLGQAIEREIVQPFFKQIQQYLQSIGGPNELGGIPLRARKKYTLDLLPPLLAAEWLTLCESELDSEQPTAALYQTVTADSIDPEDQATVADFLSQWQHPISGWLRQPAAAAAIDQVARLYQVASSKTLMHRWQFDLLHELVIGSEKRSGILPVALNI